MPKYIVLRYHKEYKKIALIYKSEEDNDPTSKNRANSEKSRKADNHRIVCHEKVGNRSNPRNWLLEKKEEKKRKEKKRKEKHAR